MNRDVDMDYQISSLSSSFKVLASMITCRDREKPPSEVVSRYVVAARLTSRRRRAFTILG